GDFSVVVDDPLLNIVRLVVAVLHRMLEISIEFDQIICCAVEPANFCILAFNDENCTVMVEKDVLFESTFFGIIVFVKLCLRKQLAQAFCHTSLGSRVSVLEVAIAKVILLQDGFFESL